jgi:hypothetical protein
MNDASPRLAEGQTGAASLLSSEEGNLRLAHHARDAARRNGVRIGVSPRNPRDRRPKPAPKRSDALGREQTTARILLQGPTAGDCDFNLAALHPAYPIKCRTSTPRTQAPESVDTRKRLPPLTH